MTIKTRWSALKRKDLRRHRRYAVDAGILRVAWLDLTGNMKTARSRALSVSEAGMALEIPEAAMPLSMIRFQSDKSNVSGAGNVRHCHRVGTKYIVGLEFTEGLNWRAPEEGVREPFP